MRVELITYLEILMLCGPWDNGRHHGLWLWSCAYEGSALGRHAFSSPRLPAPVVAWGRGSSFMLSFPGALQYKWAQKILILLDLYPASQSVEGQR